MKLVFLNLALVGIVSLWGLDAFFNYQLLRAEEKINTEIIINPFKNNGTDVCNPCNY